MVGDVLVFHPEITGWPGERTGPCLSSSRKESNSKPELCGFYCMHITFTLLWSQKILTLTTASLVAQSKVSVCSAGDPASVSGSGRSPGEGMATHSNILAWRIPWMEEPGGLQSMGSQRVGHDFTFTFNHKLGTILVELNLWREASFVTFFPGERALLR